MSSIKKVLCVYAKDNGDTLGIKDGNIYDVVPSSDFDIHTGSLYRCDFGGSVPCNIVIGGFCMYGEWQPLEEYVCMSGIYSGLEIGDTFFGYHCDGMILSPQGDGTDRFFYITENFEKVSEIPCKAKSFPRFEVRHVVYDAKENKVANDAMGECYITLAEAQELCDEMNAPKVMKPKYTKEVEYFGMKVLVPDDAKWLSTTMYGTVFAHCSKIAPSERVYFHSGSNDHAVMGGVDLNDIDWKDTLVEIK